MIREPNVVYWKHFLLRDRNSVDFHGATKIASTKNYRSNRRKKLDKKAIASILSNGSA